jgi:hypothetical protein
MARNSIGSQVHRAVLVERYFAGVSPVRLAQLGHDTHAAVARLAATGVAITYLGSTAVPEDETCFCLFAADSISAVELVNRRLLVPSVRVAGALIAEAPLPLTTEIRRR